VIAVDFKPVMRSSNTQIKPEALNLAQPLMDSIALMASEVRERVSETGRASRGSFSKYSPRSNKRGAKRFTRSGTMWGSLRIRLQSPTKVTAGFTGKAADGFSRKKDASGRSVIKKNKRGRYVRLSNMELGKILQSKERSDIIDPNALEERHLETLMVSGLGAQAIRALGFEEHGFQAARKARSLDRQAKKARRALSGRR
jgi:hypothetical protein